MSSSDADAPVGDGIDVPSSSQPHRTETADLPSSTPVEMSDLQAQQEQQRITTAAQGTSDHSGDSQIHPLPKSEQPTSTSLPAPPAPLKRAETEAIGPTTDAPIAMPAATGPTLTITLMLTTGARHPYKIDERYLEKRSVEARDKDTKEFNPLVMNAYKLKELIWKDWRSEWEPRPAAPTAIRLILMGRMLDDKTPLKDYPFNLNSHNVVHMTVKPADVIDDEENNAGKGRKGSVSREDGAQERTAGCRCVIL